LKRKRLNNKRDSFFIFVDLYWVCAHVCFVRKYELFVFSALPEIGLEATDFVCLRKVAMRCICINLMAKI
jgi:hypothetical protein